MTDTADEAAWDDPDRAVQIEDDDPETLVGEEVEFDPEAGGEPGTNDGQEDFLPDPESSAGFTENLPAGTGE